LLCCGYEKSHSEERGPVRVTTLLRRLLGVTGVVVEDFAFAEGGLIVMIRPRWSVPRCGECGFRAPGYDRAAPRRWRHLGIGRLRVWLEYAPRRVECAKCGVKTEKVPWAEHRGRFTRDFEELAAYLAQVTDQTKVTEQLGISWRSVGEAVSRVVARRLDPRRLEGLKRIGVDEFSYRRRHHYLTTVVDHDRRRVVWAAPGRSAETLARFFAELGVERTRSIETITVDMAGGYAKAIEALAPHARVVFDRFHVQRLASDALDEVRRAVVREADAVEGHAVKQSRYALLKRPWNLERREKEKLRDLQRTNRPLYRAYLLKETLAQALDYRKPGHAARAVGDWLAWASRSKLRPFVTAARTIRKHFQGVVAYFKERLTNGIVEGFNNKLRMIARRAFGFHSPEPLIAMLHLCCGGIRLDPPLPSPTKT
jgi:transposase